MFPTLTVAEHFKASTWLYQRDDPAEVQARIDRVLELFPRVKERWDQMAGNLSGGEQQQLALGMAFVAKPKLLIIDELSLGLAPTIVEQLLEIVRQIHEQGCTIVLVEQSVNVALTVASRAYFMEKGEVRFSGRRRSCSSGATSCDRCSSRARRRWVTPRWPGTGTRRRVSSNGERPVVLEVAGL